MRDVAFFVTCLTDTYYPRVGEAVVRVLRHFGCKVVFPERQTCCGQPAFNSGCHSAAAAAARRMIRVFEPYETIVTPSASCATMVRRHFAELLADDADRAAAERLGNRTHEFATFLSRVLNVNIAEHLKFDEPITFHYPCHARDVYTLPELVGWLSDGGAVDLRTPEHPDLCCGFGGVFAVDHPEISSAMLGDKLRELSATGAELVISNEAGCTLHMSGGAHRRGVPLRFKHLAECLAESLGLMEPEP